MLKTRWSTPVIALRSLWKHGLALVACESHLAMVGLFCCCSSCERCARSSPSIPKNAWRRHRISSRRGFSNSNSNCRGLALHQGIQTADFVREWHKDAHLLWQQQHDLDAQLATDVLNLQHTVSWLGDQVTVLATKSVLKCDWNSSHLCVTPFPLI